MRDQVFTSLPEPLAYLFPKLLAANLISQNGTENDPDTLTEILLSQCSM